MYKIRFVDAQEVLDGEGIVIQKFRAGQVVELSNASAMHWLSRGLALDVRAEAQAAREAKAAEPDEEKVEVVAAVNPTSPKRGRGRPPSASRPARA